MILTPVCTQQGEADTWCPYLPFSVKQSNQQAIKMGGQGWKRGILMIHSAFGERECCDFSQQSQKLRVRKDHKNYLILSFILRTREPASPGIRLASENVRARP